MRFEDGRDWRRPYEERADASGAGDVAVTTNMDMGVARLS